MTATPSAAEDLRQNGSTAPPGILPVMLPISRLRTDGGSQLRIEISRQTVEEYMELLEELPPIVVFSDGQQRWWVADGHHRLRAFRLAGRDEIPCLVYHGTRRDAILYAAGANARHGKRRTAEDVRRAVAALVGDAVWGKQSNTWIGERVGITEGRVRQIKREIQGLPVQRGRVNGTPAEHKLSRDDCRPAEHDNGRQPASNNGGRVMVECPDCGHRFDVERHLV